MPYIDLLYPSVIAPRSDTEWTKLLIGRRRSKRASILVDHRPCLPKSKLPYSDVPRVPVDTPKVPPAFLGTRVITLITPPIASDPYRELEGPRTISIRSISLTLSRCNAYAFVVLAASSPAMRLPSTRIRV